MKKSIWLSGLFLFFSTLLFSQTVPFPTAYREFTSISPWGYTNEGTTWDTSPFLPFIYKDMWYRLMPPNGVTPTVTKNSDGTISNISFNYSEPGKKYPLILFFQGAGETGNNNNKQLLHGGETHKNAVLSNKFPGYLLYPQSVDYDKAKDLIDKLIATYPSIDINRIYVHGLSNGAKWTWQFAINNPTLVAAMAPMSGAAPDSEDPDLLYTPIRLAQGGLDTNPAPVWTQSINAWFQAQGGHMEYFLFPTLGHGTWNTMYARPDFFSWFLQYKKNTIQVLFNKTEFCPGETVSTTMGFTPGFDAYEWRKDGNPIAGTAYKITVTSFGLYTGRIKNRGVWSDWSEPVEIKEKATTVTPPIQLAQLHSVVIPDINGNSDVVLTLPAGYETYEYNKVGGASNPIGSTQSKTVSTTGSYTATVKEVGGCSSNPSVPFVIIDANGGPKPDAISNLQAAALSKTQIKLTWDNNASPTVNETGFEIYRSRATGEPYSLIVVTAADVLTYTDNNLDANTNYFYKIRPIGNNGAATPSAVVSALTEVDSTAPTAPNNLVVSSTSQTSVGLSWAASTDNVGVTAYDVYLRPASQSNYIKAYTTTLRTQLVTGLTSSTMYNFIVKAKDQAGNVSVASNQVNAATVLTGLNYSYYEGTWSMLPDFSALTPIKTGTVSTFSITSTSPRPDYFGFVFTGFIQIPTTGNYTFFTSSDDGSKLWVDGVQIVTNDGAHGTQEASGVMSLSAGYYPIRCEYFEITGGQILTVSWQGPGINKQAIPASRLKENYTLPAAPAAPTGLKRTVLDYKSIKIDWNTYTGTGTDMEIYRSSPNGSTWYIIATIPASQNTYTNTDLTASTLYYYRLRAVNSGNVSAYTGSVNGTTSALPPLPAVPTGLLVQAVSANSVSIKWTDASNNEENFEVFRSTGDNASYSKLVTLPADTKQYIDNSPFAHTKYYYKVASKNVRGSSAFSNEVQTTTTNNAPVVSSIGDITMRFDEEKLFEIEATDADNDFLIFGATITPALPEDQDFIQIADYGDGTAYFSITPKLTDEGVYQIKLFVKDSYLGSDTVQFSITVNSNHTPVIAPISAQTVKETNTINFAVTATDADNDSIAWSLQNAPAFLTSIPNGNTLNVTVQPGDINSGVYNVTFVATDVHGSSASQLMTLTVEDYNPNFKVKVNFRTDVLYNGPADWNNVNNTIGLTQLNKEDGSSSEISLSMLSSWEGSRDVYGLSPGVYPTVVNRSYLSFYGSTAHNLLLQGLDKEGKYNLSFLSNTTLDLGKPWTTTFTISGQTQSIDARNNASTLVVFNGVTPNAQGELTIAVQGPSDWYAALNAMVVESFYEGNNPPAAPTNLEASVLNSAVQLTWQDNANNDLGVELYKSLDNSTFTQVLTLAKDVATYTDNTFVAGTTYYYKVRAINSKGASDYSNTASVLAPNRIPVILPIAPFSIPEMDMKWLEVTAADGDGDPLSFTLENEPGFVWTEYVDDNKVNIVFAPFTGDHNSYEFLLHADDGHGGVATATISLTVYSASDVEYKINFTGTTVAPSPWNNVTNTAANTTLTGLVDINSSPSGVSLKLLNAWDGLNTNGNNTGNNSGLYPDAVMTGSFYDLVGTPKSIQLTGLKAEKTYDFTFFASRMGVADVRNTIYTIGSKSGVLNASGNTSNTVKITGVKTDALGQLTIGIVKQAGAAYGYLGAMVVREYEAVIVPTVPEKPLGLISQVLTRTSIQLNWQDASSDETGFEIWKSVGGSTNYTLLTAVGAGVTSYKDTGLTQSTQYYYKVRAINGNGPSPYSNETSASTYDFSVSVNFNALNGPATNWNNITAFLNAGYILNNLTDDKGINSGISMTVVEEFAGDNPWGNNTGNNSGIVPDNVMAGSFWIDRGGEAKLRFGGLSFLKKYNFSFFASRAADGDRNTIYTINGTSVTVNASNNTTNLVQLKDIEPELDGTITITITTSQTALYGYLNGLILQAVPNPGGGGGARMAGKQATELSNADAKAESALELSEAYPNPFVDGVTLRLGSKMPDKFVVSLINATGLEVYITAFDKKPNTAELELMFKSDLSEGVYILRVIESSGNSQNIRLIKK